MTKSVELDQFSPVQSAWCWNFSTQIRSQHRYDRGFGRAGLPFAQQYCRVSIERRESTTVPQSAGHCTPYRWFHPGMDLHFVTLPLEKRILLFTRGIISSGEPASLGSETTQTMPARLDVEIGDVLTPKREVLRTQRPWSAHRVVTRPDCATPCRRRAWFLQGVS